MLIIKEILEKSSWDKFFNENGSPSFLQSWEWGEVQVKMGYKILRLGLYEGQKLNAIALVIKIKAKRGNLLFIPHGPVFMEHGTRNIKQINKIISQYLNFLISICNKENYSFIRTAPTLVDTPENRKIFQNLGFKTAPIYMHAERTWVLDLNKSEEELLNGMRKTTRYLIKRADRDGVIIEERKDEKAFDEFWKIYKETAVREKFVPYSLNYVKNEYNEFHKTGNVLFLFGKVKSEIRNSKLETNSNDQNYKFKTFNKLESSNLDIVSDFDIHASNLYYASALILFTKSSAFYHQGASIHTKFPVTYRLQWEAIKQAKQRGCYLYNFWGIKNDRTPKNWDGISLFKTGFDGRQIDYVPTQDYVISPKYYFTYIYEKYLAWKRGV